MPPKAMEKTAITVMDADKFLKLFGVSVKAVAEVAKAAKITFSEAAFVLWLPRSNLTWDMIAFTSELFFNQVFDERTCRQKWDALSTRILAVKDDLVKPDIRFTQIDARFPRATAIVDVTPVSCRQLKKTVNAKGKPVDGTYQVKYHDHVQKFEVWSTILGIPIAWKGPQQGKDHDMTLYRDGEPFPHCESELFLADLGYLRGNHALHPFKATDEERANPTPAMKEFDQNLATVRSRIERLFGWLCEFRIFHHCALEDERLEQAFSMIMIFYHRHMMSKEPVYKLMDVPPGVTVATDSDPICGCQMQDDPHWIQDMKRHRSELCREYIPQHAILQQIPTQ